MSSDMQWDLEVCHGVVLSVAMLILCESAVYCKKHTNL